MSNNETITKTITVTVLLCIVCSVVVSVAAVFLRPIQEVNKALNFKGNILAAAGLLTGAEGESIQVIFDERVTMRAIDFDTGLFTDTIDVDAYDQGKAAKNSALSDVLADSDDIAKISRREKLGLVYMVQGDSGLETIILPVRGYGLWSTLYGFIALDADLNTVKGLGFYQHGETPGLGGEVDNPKWKAQWSGKEVYAEDGHVALQLIKGTVDSSSAMAVNQIDGLSGATLTGRGVTNLVRFWLGDKGYKSFLNHLKNGEA